MCFNVWVRFKILGSSSSGNCALLQTAQKTILIDAGFPGRRIKEMLAREDVALEDLDAVFITHEHGDHTCGLKVLSRLPKLRVFANHATRQAIEPSLKQQPNWTLFESGSTFQFGDMHVTAFPIPHDAYDPVGFVFKCGGDDLFNPLRSVAWLTDLGYIPGNIQERVRDVDVLVLEANYDSEMLESDPHRPWSLKQRIRGRHGHLSNDAALAFIRGAQRPAWQRVYLAHLSRDCNDTALVRREFGNCVDGSGRCPIIIVDPVNGGPESITIGGWATAQ